MDVRAILREARTMAVVGLSANPERDSNSVARYLQGAGYRIIPVNPNEDEVLGERAYASLHELPEAPDIVVVFRRPEQTPPIAREAVEVGAKVLWLQLGIANEESRRIAEEGRIAYIEDACIRTVHHFLARNG